VHLIGIRRQGHRLHPLDQPQHRSSLKRRDCPELTTESAERRAGHPCHRGEHNRGRPEAG
jgi:hypothetical protein